MADCRLLHSVLGAAAAVAAVHICTILTVQSYTLYLTSLD